jgi:hypothetical protein
MTPEDLTPMDSKTYHLLPSETERARFLRHIERTNMKPTKFQKRPPSLFISWGPIILAGDNPPQNDPESCTTIDGKS